MYSILFAKKEMIANATFGAIKSVESFRLYKYLLSKAWNANKLILLLNDCDFMTASILCLPS
jgi:hypothetical protein